MLRGGVIGFGNVGQHIIRYINADPVGRARIVAACNRGPGNLAVARGEVGLEATSSLDELLDRKLDFVVVASTSAGHADQVAAAAARGVAVFCEKPIALTLLDADRMIAAARRAGVITVVNYSMRFIDAYQRIRDLARTGELGDVLVVRHSKTRGYGLHAMAALHCAIEEPVESGGWTVHHACHDIDFLYWVHGPMRRAYGLHRPRRRHRPLPRLRTRGPAVAERPRERTAFPGRGARDARIREDRPAGGPAARAVLQPLTAPTITPFTK